MKRITIVCDNAKAHPTEEAEGKPRAFPLDLDYKKKLQVLDLCDPCNLGMTLQEVRELLEEAGQDLDAQPDAPAIRRGPGRPRNVTIPTGTGETPITTEAGIYVCPLEGCESHKPWFRRSSFSMHTRAEHGVGLGDLEAEYGNVNRVNDPEYRPLLTKYPCDYPGCKEAFPAAQAKGKHQRDEHRDWFADKKKEKEKASA